MSESKKSKDLRDAEVRPIVIQGTTSIASSLPLALALAQSVAKDSTNNFHRYKYASAEALIAEARGALAEAGLAFLPLRWEFVAFTGANLEAPGLVGRMFVYYRLIHQSGETLDLESSTPVIVEKGRPLDKAEATALTYNLGYFLRGLLLLPREDAESSVDARDDRGRDDRGRDDRRDGRREERQDDRRSSAKSAPRDEEEPKSEAQLMAEAEERAHFTSKKNEIKSAIESCADLETLSKMSADIIKVGFPKPFADEIRAAYKARRFRLEADAKPSPEGDASEAAQ